MYLHCVLQRRSVGQSISKTSLAENTLDLESWHLQDSTANQVRRRRGYLKERRQRPGVVGCWED